MSVKKSNKQLYRVIQIMTLTGTLVVANVLFTMVTHRHIWSGQDVLDTQIASSIVNTSVEAKRGTIYDRNHNVIAQEVTAYTVVAYLDDSLEDEDGNPDYVKDADYTAKQLGTVLDNINEEKVAKIIEDAIDDERSQTELGTGTKRLDKDTMEKIKDLNLPGIDFIETTNRNYPTTPFSSNLIGFAAYDEEKEKISGVMGLEQTLDEYLSGKDGQVQYQQTVDGSILPGTTQVFEEAEDGKDVVLTLDASLQRTVEEQMQITMEQNNAEAAWCAVMEVETGKILAWASYPTFDQNKHLEIPSYQDRISQAVYEPGSVMKPFTYAIALDTGVFPRNTTFRAGTFTYTFDPNTNKITRVANGTETAYPPISDALEEDFGVITFEQGLAFSSNVGICELLSNYVNYNQYVDYMDKFDFFKYVDSPYVSPFSSMIAGNTLSTYALPYYGNITYYGDQNSPLSRFSTGLTRFTTKSMYIFDKVGIENTLLANDISNILLNSLLSYFTGNIFGLNIWGSSDISYTSGFEAIIRPFRNMAFSYSYMTEQNMNMTTFQFKFGYNRNGNLAVINAHSFGDNTPVNTTTGVEWQFYF